ncbi:glutamate-cysteine ligase family protein [Bacteriovoracales bacterium]|nr:glutamate-cysteine ligase family protein [Bacteriovoracales bacterium]
MSIFIGTDSHYIQGKKKFPSASPNGHKFQFGLEAEFFLVNNKTFDPLWYKDLTFKKLNGILENIPFEDLGGRLDLLSLEEPSTKVGPYVIEGYHVTDKDFKIKDLLPKGVEIRTPVFSSIEDCLNSYKILFERMQNELKKNNLLAVSLSHHPQEDYFRGPQNKRRYDYWQWAMEVMTTYGPDINVSVPLEELQDFDQDDFLEKVNYYSPALACLSTGSPFYKNKPCVYGDNELLSLRTYKRSVIAPPIELHEDEENRFEFKIFEMTPYIEDFHSFYILFLTVLFDKDLKGRSDKATLIYEMGEASKRGLRSDKLRKRLEQIVKRAPLSLEKFGFDLSSLEKVKKRIRERKTLSDELLLKYQEGSSLKDIFRFLSKIY